jgi:hypothetical protein
LAWHQTMIFEFGWDMELVEKIQKLKKDDDEEEE